MKIMKCELIERKEQSFDDSKYFEIRKDLTQKNMFYIEPIFIGDADEGAEGIYGHQRHYKIGNQFVITEDNNPQEYEEIIDIWTDEQYEKEYGRNTKST